MLAFSLENDFQTVSIATREATMRENGILYLTSLLQLVIEPFLLHLPD